MAKRKTKIEIPPDQLKVLLRGIERVWNEIAPDLDTMDPEFDNYSAIECCVDANRLEDSDKAASAIFRKVRDSYPDLDGYYEFLKYLERNINLV